MQSLSLFIFCSDSSSSSNQSSHPFSKPIAATKESSQKSVPESGENDWEYLSHPPDRRAESTSYSSNAVCGKRVDAKKSHHAKRLSSPDSNIRQVPDLYREVLARQGV